MEHYTLTAIQEQALTRIWQKSKGTHSKKAENWEADMKHAYDLGLGMQELLQFLYSNRPDLMGFLHWAGGHASFAEEEITGEDDVLSEADLEHWKQHGFVVIRAAVSEEAHRAANLAIWEFLGANPLDAESWYLPHPAKNGLMVVFTQHRALHAIRNASRIRKAFEQLYCTTAIYKVIDKVSFNPPQNDHYKFAGSPLHWDTSLELPIPARLQGLLYLNDVTADGGAFQCVPGFHNSIHEWMQNLPAGIDPRQHALQTLHPVSVPGNAGDFIIWHQALPHCASPNLSNRPRLVQYLTYIPENYQDNRAWI
jgi:hypothetical protein